MEGYKEVKKAMIDAGINAGELAQKMNMAAGTLSAKMNRKSEFTIEEAKKIRDILGVPATVPIEEFFEWKED